MNYDDRHLCYDVLSLSRECDPRSSVFVIGKIKVRSDETGEVSEEDLLVILNCATVMHLGFHIAVRTKLDERYREGFVDWKIDYVRMEPRTGEKIVIQFSNKY